MSPDPHDDYYARKHAHRAEVFSAIGRLRTKDLKWWRPYLVAAAVLIVATSAGAGWLMIG